MRDADFGAADISLCSGLQFCVAPQVVPTAARTAAGQPGLLRPGRTCFVSSARTGYANRPKSGNWRYKDFHLARSSALSAAPPPPASLPPAPKCSSCSIVGSRTGAVLRRFRLSVDFPFPLEVPHEPNREPVSSPRHLAPSVRISRARRSCLLLVKLYETYPAGASFRIDFSTVPGNR